jgi:hypothetical protein
MNERIQRALDGELPASELDPADAKAYRRYRDALESAGAHVAGLPDIDVSRAVMRRIRPAVHHGWLARAGDWLWSPRALSLSVRPAFAMAGSLALAALAWMALSTPGAPTTAVAPSVSPTPARMLVQFRLGDAAAHEVALVGDFNAWQPGHRLHETAAGVWSVEVALEPGVYNYGFMVDGTIWRLDPLAPQVSDGFGGASSRVAVMAPEIRL